MSEFARELAQLGVRESLPAHVGAFYGTASSLAPGAGLIYTGVTFPVFNTETGRFQARKGPILILTHECDIDPANDRCFNEHFVFAPLIPLKDFAEQYQAAKDEARTIVVDTAKRKIFRLMFLPPPHNLLEMKELEFGALVYWNTLSNTHISQLGAEGCSPIGALSSYGLELADGMFRQHFLRPKSDRLAILR